MDYVFSWKRNNQKSIPTYIYIVNFCGGGVLTLGCSRGITLRPLFQAMFSSQKSAISSSSSAESRDPRQIFPLFRGEKIAFSSFILVDLKLHFSSQDTIFGKTSFPRHSFFQQIICSIDPIFKKKKKKTAVSHTYQRMIWVPSSALYPAILSRSMITPVILKFTNCMWLFMNEYPEIKQKDMI